eukprot:12582451-Alexandrium_andersonii.AAC.1
MPQSARFGSFGYHFRCRSLSVQFKLRTPETCLRCRRGELGMDGDCSAGRPGDCGLPLWPGGRRLSCERRAI